MKIILTQIGHPNFRGGGNILAHKLCDEFFKKGHDVTGIFLSPEEFLNKTEGFNYNIIVIKGSKIPFINLFRCWKALISIFKMGEPDVVISLGYEGLPVSYIKKKAFFIAASHSPWLRYFGIKDLIFSKKLFFPSLWGKWLFDASFFLDRMTKMRADVIQSSCRFGIDQCINIYGIPSEKTSVIPNGIDVNQFFIQKRTDEKNIIFWGGSVEYKGLDILVQAMPEVLKQHSDANVIIVGDMTDQRGKMILNNASNLKVVGKLVMKGLIPQGQVKDCYKNIFLTVIPSRLDLSPMVALESMASGVPIVASNVGGLSELVINKENGLIVEKENPQKLAEAIIYLFNNPIKAEEMGIRGRKIAEEEFIWEKIVEKFEKEIDKRINNRV